MVWYGKAVEVCWGQMWSGGFRSGEAVKACYVEAGWVRFGPVRLGGSGMLGSGKLGYGMARRSWCVPMWRGPVWRGGRGSFRFGRVGCVQAVEFG